MIAPPNGEYDVGVLHIMLPIRSLGLGSLPGATKDRTLERILGVLSPSGEGL